MQSNLSLEGRVAMVTGARRGIGAAIAERLAAQGASVLVAARTANADGISSVIERITSRGGIAKAVGFDLADSASRTDAISRSEEVFGPIDILVNNAAILGGWGNLASVEIDQISKGFEVNVNAVLDLIQQCLPGMKDRKFGRILNITSGMATQPLLPYLDTAAPISHALAPYGATKAALDRITFGLAAELLGTGVRVNGLMPQGVSYTGNNTPGAIAILKRDPTRGEGLEVMAEAALLLICAPLTGVNMKSRDVLFMTDSPLHSLDGRQVIGNANTLPDLDI